LYCLDLDRAVHKVIDCQATQLDELIPWQSLDPRAAKAHPGKALGVKERGRTRRSEIGPTWSTFATLGVAYQRKLW
jgi:hypothetical protein